MKLWIVILGVCLCILGMPFFITGFNDLYSVGQYSLHYPYLFNQAIVTTYWEETLFGLFLIGLGFIVSIFGAIKKSKERKVERKVPEPPYL